MTSNEMNQDQMIEKILSLPRDRFEALIEGMKAFGMEVGSFIVAYEYANNEKFHNDLLDYYEES